MIIFFFELSLRIKLKALTLFNNYNGMLPSVASKGANVASDVSNSNVVAENQ
jgi:hypothetical protein